VGKDIKFDTATLKVEEHTPFKVVFDNQDEAVPHNFHLYRSGPPATDSIAATEIAQGPVVQELVVDGLDAGTYYFQCDVHPATMSGSLEVG
jgi:plastocyanin